jgi:hypothetical protein
MKSKNISEIHSERDTKTRSCLPFVLEFEVCMYLRSQEQLEDFKKKIRKISISNRIELQSTTGPPAFPNGGPPIHRLS